MNSCPRQCGSCPHGCSGSQDDMVCRCLGVTEEDLIRAISRFELRTVKEIRSITGAGDGCNACHKKLSTYLPAFAPSQSAPTLAVA